jgi:hypothetical protein
MALLITAAKVTYRSFLKVQRARTPAFEMIGWAGFHDFIRIIVCFPWRLIARRDRIMALPITAANDAPRRHLKVTACRTIAIGLAHQAAKMECIPHLITWQNWTHVQL